MNQNIQAYIVEIARDGDTNSEILEKYGVLASCREEAISRAEFQIPHHVEFDVVSVKMFPLRPAIITSSRQKKTINALAVIAGGMLLWYEPGVQKFVRRCKCENRENGSVQCHIYGDDTLVEFLTTNQKGV